MTTKYDHLLENGKHFGQIIYIHPTPEAFDWSADELERLRSLLCEVRRGLDNLMRDDTISCHNGADDGNYRRLRDANGMVQGAIISLYDPMENMMKQAKWKRVAFHDGSYVFRERDESIGTFHALRRKAEEERDAALRKVRELEAQLDAK